MICYLKEANRRELANKTKVQSRARYYKRLNYQIVDHKNVDYQQLFEDDLLVFNTPINQYICTLAFTGVLDILHDEIFKSRYKAVTLQLIISALRKAFDKDNNFEVNCTCPDFRYRFAYAASKNGYKYGSKETRPANITNPDDNIGSTCKHLSLLLNNKDWLVKVGTTVNNILKANIETLYETIFTDKEIEAMKLALSSTFLSRSMPIPKMLQTDQVKGKTIKPEPAEKGSVVVEEEPEVMEEVPTEEEDNGNIDRE